MTNIARVVRTKPNRVCVGFDYNLGAELVYCVDKRHERLVLVVESLEPDAAPLSEQDRADALAAAKEEFKTTPPVFSQAA